MPTAAAAPPMRGTARITSRSTFSVVMPTETRATERDRPSNTGTTARTDGPSVPVYVSVETASRLGIGDRSRGTACRCSRGSGGCSGALASSSRRRSRCRCRGGPPRRTAAAPTDGSASAGPSAPWSESATDTARSSERCNGRSGRGVGAGIGDGEHDPTHHEDGDHEDLPGQELAGDGRRPGPGEQRTHPRRVTPERVAM